MSTGTAPASTGGPASTGTASTGAASTGAAASTAQVMGWGDDWRQRIAAGSTDVEKDRQQLERYESPQAIWKKARELERKISSGEYRSMLPKGATAEETARWRTDNGIPAKPEEYKINMPAGKQAPKEDDPFLKAFLKSAHAQNFTQAQVDASIGSFYDETDRQVEALEAAEVQAVKDTDDKLHQIWGKDYRVNKNMADALLARAPAGFKDKFMNGYLGDRSPIKASVEAWQWLVQLEREINPMASVMPNLSGDPAKNLGERISELKGLMGNPNSAYWKGPKADAMQEEYRGLLAAEAKLKEKGQQQAA